MVKQEEIIKFFEVNGKQYPVKVIFTENLRTYMTFDKGFYTLKIRKFFLNTPHTEKFVADSINKLSKDAKKENLAINWVDKYFYFLGNKVYFNYMNHELSFTLDSKTYKEVCLEEIDAENFIWDILSEKLYPILVNLVNKHLPNMDPYKQINDFTIKVVTKTSNWACIIRREKRIIFTKYLSFYEEKMIESVVVHELAHLQYHGHNKAFYQLVENNYPNYKAVTKKLNQHIFKLTND